MTQAEIDDYVNLMLGGSNVETNITTGSGGDLEKLTNTGLRYLAKYRPKLRRVWLTATADKQKYDLTALSIDFGEKVVDVFPPVTSPVSWNVETALLGLPANLLPTHPAHELGDYLAREMELENLRRALAQDFSWQFEFEDVGGSEHGVLWISPVPGAQDVFELICAHSPTLAEVPLSDEDWLRDYTLALAKISVGMARRKYESAASGVRMDGSSLVSEGIGEKKELERDIRKRMLPIFTIPRAQ